MSFHELAKARYSVRSFNQCEIQLDKLNRVLESGHLAPTACNNQPQRIKIITDPSDLAKVDECTPFRFNAPTVLLVCYDKTVSWKRKYDGADSGEIDASIFITHVILAAQEVGLGTCWVMCFDPEKTIELFSLPDNIVPVAFLPIGYPAEDAAPAKGHNNRVPLKRILLK